MLEKIKEVPFIDESSAVKVMSSRLGTTLLLERTDKVVWGKERIPLVSTGIDCYVEADKFYSLLPEIESLSQDTCLVITLKNGAKYELPFLPVSWEPQEMPETYEANILFKLDDLMLCTLSNLIKPDLQCIWVDSQGAVSCDFVSACVSNSIKSEKGFLIPPDVQQLINGKQCDVSVDEVGKHIYFEGEDFVLATTMPEIVDEWWTTLREMLAADVSYIPVANLDVSLKRLKMFGDYVSFEGDKVVSNTNFEPFQFKDITGKKYEIEKILKLLDSVGSIAENGGNLNFKNDKSIFMVSPMEEA